MVPLRYWILRLLRRATPKWLVDELLDRGIFLKAGQETREPLAAVATYIEAAKSRNMDLRSATVVICGYGGSYGVALGLLEEGVRQVILQDPFAPLRAQRIAALPADLRSGHLKYVSGSWETRSKRMILERRQLLEVAHEAPEVADLVLSNSVLEHVDDVAGHIRACSELTRPGGLNIHRIDLRDHVFSYPFEMLCYSEKVWRRWLNASNNLNRWRLPWFEDTFKAYFGSVTIRPIVALPKEFHAAKARIRPEFLSGDDKLDAVGVALIEAVK